MESFKKFVDNFPFSPHILWGLKKKFQSIQKHFTATPRRRLFGVWERHLDGTRALSTHQVVQRWYESSHCQSSMLQKIGEFINPKNHG